MTLEDGKCYECDNYNHKDCTVRLGRKNASCTCDCKSNPHYEVIVPSIQVSVR